MRVELVVVVVAVDLGFGVAVAFDFSPPLKPSAEGVEGDLRLPTNRGKPGGPPGWGRLSLVTFFGEAKKVTWARHPGYQMLFNSRRKALTRKHRKRRIVATAQNPPSAPPHKTKKRDSTPRFFVPIASTRHTCNAPVKSPGGCAPRALNAASRSAIPSSLGRPCTRVINRRMEVVS